MQTQQDLLNKIEELKKEAIELEIKRQKELENKQRDLITQHFMELLDSQDYSEESIWAVIVSFTGCVKNPRSFSWYSKSNDTNLLLARKLINRFAREQEIRYEDSHDIIANFIARVPINYEEIIREFDNRRSHPEKKFFPIFFI
jgi:hypothetical protein